MLIIFAKNVESAQFRKEKMNEGNEKYPQIDNARSADPDCSSFCYSYFL